MIGDLNGDGLPEGAVTLEPGPQSVPKIAILSPTGGPDCFRSVYEGLGLYKSVELTATKTQDWTDVNLMVQIPIHSAGIAVGFVRMTWNGTRYGWSAPLSCRAEAGGEEIAIPFDTCAGALAEIDPDQPSKMTVPESSGTDGTPKSPETARAAVEDCASRDDCKTACDGGRASACRVLGESLRDEAPKNLVQALSLFKKGCDGDDGMACNDYASALYFGEGTGKNLKAAEQAGSKACELLKAEEERLTRGNAQRGEVLLAEQQTNNACQNYHGFQCSAAAFSPGNRQPGKDALCRDLGFGGKAWGAVTDCSGALAAAARCQTSDEYSILCCP